MAKLTVKRIIPLFSVITERFKQELEQNSLNELKMIDEQILAATSQINHLQSKLGLVGTQSDPQTQDQQVSVVKELQGRLEKLQSIKKTLVASFDSAKQKPLGDIIQTGVVENYVELKTGDNIREIYSNARIVIKDDIIQEIVE